MDNAGSRNIQGKVPDGIDGLRSSALQDIAYISITDLSQTKRMMENTKAGVTPCLGMNKIKSFHFPEILAKIVKFAIFTKCIWLKGKGEIRWFCCFKGFINV